MSGTSMASPGAAGAVACVMSTSPSSACRYPPYSSRSYRCTHMIMPNPHPNPPIHSSSSAFVGKLRNPRVAISQPGGDKPLTYLASGSTGRCP